MVLRNAFEGLAVESKQETGLATQATLAAILAELAQKLEAGQEVALDAATLAALETINAVVSGAVAVSNFPATQPVSGPLTDAELRATPVPVSGTVSTGALTDTQMRASDVAVKDAYLSDEALPAQDGADAVLTFTFAGARDLIWVRSEGGTSFAKVTGTPALDDGIYCEDGVPQPLTVRASVVKVWAPTGAKVYCWGFS